MADRAISDHAGVQAQLDRLVRGSLGRDVLGLDRIRALLTRLGDPHLAMPPVFHVAGTNGKGSTCAFLRAAIEAAGLTTHVYTSPHLVRFNERFRVAGRLIEDDWLEALLAETLTAAEGQEITFFEATTVVAFLAFARTPADASIVEVGIGGRFDATNVVEDPAVCGVAQLGIDHSLYLGNTLPDIAGEKAGIAKRGVALVTQAYPEAVAERIGTVAEAAGARWLPRRGSWDAAVYRNKLHYRDEAGALELPLPRLHGGHQPMNAALAVAMLRHQSRIEVPDTALRAAMGWADWPARLQLLLPGPLRNLLPAESELWLDGAHNPAASRAIADFFRTQVPAERPFHIVCGLLADKDPVGVLRQFRGRSLTVHAVPIPGYESHPPAALIEAARAAGLNAVAADSARDALAWIGRHADRARPPIVLIMGSLYLAGTILRDNEQPPT